MPNLHEQTCFCRTCDRWFNPLGIMSHAAMHRRKGEDCTITYTHGNTRVFKNAQGMKALIGEPK